MSKLLKIIVIIGILLSISAKSSTSFNYGISNVISFSGVEATVEESQLANVLEVSKLLKNNNKKVEITGFAYDDFNYEWPDHQLAKQRAYNIKLLLMCSGIQSDRMIVRVGDKNDYKYKGNLNRVVTFNVLK